MTVGPTDPNPAPTDPVEIACDESGSEGENLIETRQRVFAHGSVDLTVPEADVVVRTIRKQFGVSGEELKAKRLLTEANLNSVATILAPGGPLAGRTGVYLLDKLYFAVGKVIDLLVEEEAHDRGLDLYAGGVARQMASTLFNRGRRALGSAPWERLLGAFVSLVRRQQRTGTKATLDEFFTILDSVRVSGHDRRVEAVLQTVWASREQARQYGGDGWQSTLRSLDPLFAAIPMTTAYWAERHGRPVRLVHDRQTILTPDLVEPMVEVMNNPHPDFPHPVSIVGVDQVDSRADTRVQLADLVAGFGRIAGERALAGELTPPLVSAIRPMLNGNDVWDDEPSWLALTGRRIGG